ncbi:pyridoxamine 5'-phosphate oxidase family protein [Streptacidiphilus neutrinimicus]|uniref:pyridoxamine 5'-phosphate oxidase family protein n=1 Tax=Streptacidiphilus neutrinimicus TaxID=105420 RepID=UPI0005A8C772|nr:pyridoxamine 5'-phosphate oxidase family protein [Streptacidiphilus neutrinimicus]
MSERIGISWAEMRVRLVGARSYWVSTASPAAVPHAMPVWGVWLGERFWFSTGSGTAKARNLASNPRVSVHLESAAEVVSVSGVAEAVPEAARPPEVDAAYAAKYALPRTGEPATIVVGGSPVFAVTPRRAHGWFEGAFAESMTRWRFPEAGGAPVAEAMSYPPDPV